MAKGILTGSFSNILETAHRDSEFKRFFKPLERTISRAPYRKQRLHIVCAGACTNGFAGSENSSHSGM